MNNDIEEYAKALVWAACSLVFGAFFEAGSNLFHATKLRARFASLCSSVTPIRRFRCLRRLLKHSLKQWGLISFISRLQQLCVSGL